MKYTIGLDIGIASCGWAVINNDKDRIEDLGVHIFLAAETPKDGSPLAAPRREARSARRRLKRRAKRMKDIKKLFIDCNLLTKVDVQNLNLSLPKDITPYTIRTKGLDELLTPEEWARALLHIAKRRGYKSNSKEEKEHQENKAGKKENDTETGKILTGIKENKERLLQGNYRTIGEMFFKDSRFTDCKRNKEGDYSHTIDRDSLENEIHMLFSLQRSFGNTFATEAIEQTFCNIYLSQLPIQSVEHMIGYCTFEKTEKRAPVNSYTGERFTLLQKIANLKIISNHQEKSINLEQYKPIIKLAYENVKVTYKQLRKVINIADNATFKSLKYYEKGVYNKKVEDDNFIELKGYHAIKKAITNALGEKYWHNLEITTNMDPTILDTIAYAVTIHKEENAVVKELQEQGITDINLIESVKRLSFSKAKHLSIKAMQNIIPFMEQGDRYNEACQKAGYDHANPNEGRNNKKEFLPILSRDEITNPVVFRALTRTRKVVNAIIRKYGSPHSIHIETTKELAKSKKDRDEISKNQEQYQKEKKTLATEFTELVREPKGKDLIKYRLWKEQNGFCAYTTKQNIKAIELNRLSEPGYVEIDHIIPYSRSFDDSITNQVLVKGEENRNKGNRTPYEYIAHHSLDEWHAFTEWVKTNIKNRAKQLKLLRENYDAHAENEMRSRNLHDTGYITTYMANYLRENLQFADTASKKPVITIKGEMTAYLRHRWGLNKDRSTDLHHALDAAIVAVASESMVQKIARWSRGSELYLTTINDQIVNFETGEVTMTAPEKIDNKRLITPWEHFRQELNARLSDNPAEEIKNTEIHTYTVEELNQLKPVFVSRMAKHKVTGEAHKASISRFREEEQIKVIKMPLEKINLKNLETIFDKKRNLKLYTIIKERLEMHEGNAKKAFQENIYMPTNDGNKGPQIKGIRLADNSSTGIKVNGGIADNAAGSMVKTDVYSKEGKYFLVPFYVSDIIQKKPIKHAIVKNRPKSQWIFMDETYTFLFSLFPNDLIQLNADRGKIFGYLRSVNSGSGQLLIDTHDRRQPGIGKKPNGWDITITTVNLLEKYQVDMLGNYTKVKKEKQQ